MTAQQLKSEQKTVTTMCVSIWELPTRLSTRYQVHNQCSTCCCPTHEMWELPTPLTMANSPNREMRYGSYPLASNSTLARSIQQSKGTATRDLKQHATDACMQCNTMQQMPPRHRGRGRGQFEESAGQNEDRRSAPSRSRSRHEEEEEVGDLTPPVERMDVVIARMMMISAEFSDPLDQEGGGALVARRFEYLVRDRCWDLLGQFLRDLPAGVCARVLCERLGAGVDHLEQGSMTVRESDQLRTPRLKQYGTELNRTYQLRVYQNRAALK
ncbi:hypothetical protein F511_36705 [Dorcoceras hygrometricum]|uniref:Uncharacterized protein n=1 Tax=Dorcoceras hygrometricum TaxID=472368 RepID=A0A2Z7A9X3_9LAMI|nr:hypothetical protein F511_36705 [Dorcoceras hygrometricum]